MNNPKSNTRGALIGFIIFLILGILLLIFCLWWFVWRNNLSPLIRYCSTSTQCYPNEVCTTGVCGSVSCTTNSQCNGVANGSGGAFCVRGYCQTASCNSTSDCLNLGADYVCTNTAADVATPWINSACVKVGNDCKSDNDCYGGKYGLICVKAEGQETGVCQQCGSNIDCAGEVCQAGICSECTEDAQCSSGSVCGNGTCCSEPKYSVNSLSGQVNSCLPGDLYDLCVDDGDCASGHCIDLGNEIKICGGGSNGTYTFSAGTIVQVGIPSEVAKYTCPTPGGPNDTTATPFAVDGACDIYSAFDQYTGSACGRPSFCNKPSKANNLLCNGNVSFSNPFATSCDNASDCTTGYGCSNIKLCGPGCNVNKDCPYGFICSKVSLENQADGYSGVCQYPSKKISCTAEQCSTEANCPCPSGYGCDSSSSVCVWQSSNSDNVTPPPPFIVDSICSRPATALPQLANGSTNFIPSYCVNGFCSTNPGWINAICVSDNDCTYLEGDDTDQRTSLICVDNGEFSVCQGSIGGIPRA